MTQKLNPFFFPTSMVFIDDEIEFINSFSMLLDAKLPIHAYRSARDALALINNQTSIFENLTEFTDFTLLENVDQKICLNVNALHKQIYNDERFSQISVVITDYAMPEMDGLDLLSQIKHPEIKRIMLTGVADEKIAVKAFNEGLIDRFFLKNTIELDKEINKAIKELQEHYFRLLGEPVYHALSDYTVTFLTDPHFQKLFSRMHAKYCWVEYYIFEQPQRLFLLDETGETSCFFIFSEEEMRSHYEVAVAENAPTELLKMLDEGEHISWFPSEDGHYSSDFSGDNWQDYLHPTDFFYKSDKKYYCALVTPSPLQNIDMAKVRSFRDFLKDFDKKAISD